jgi:hypothetical protein
MADDGISGDVGKPGSLNIGFLTPFCPGRASHRYRVQAPILALRRMGENAHINSGDVTIFGKHEDILGKAVGAIRKRGGTVIFDVCDDHFKSSPKYAPAYFSGCKEADVVVSSTATIQRRVKEETGRDSVIIGDPYLFPECSPAMVNGGRNILWYGHCNNIPGLLEIMPKLTGTLTIVSNIDIATRGWSHNNTLDALAWCDVVIIPTSVENQYIVPGDLPHPAGKSPNRLVEAVRRGRYVITDTVVEAYKPYGMWHGDILEGLDWVRRNPREALDQVRKAQSLVKQLNDPMEIGKQWRDVCYGARRNLYRT